MRARLAQPRASQGGLADGEFALDEMVQRDTACDDIAARKTRRHVDIVIPFERFNGFELDQCDMPTRTWIIRISSHLVEIAVPFESAAGDGARFTHRSHRSRTSRRHV